MGSWFQRVFNRSEPPKTNAPSEAKRVQNPTSAAERRSCARVNLELQVRVRFETAEALVASRTFDISRSGAFIAIREPRPRGTRVRLTVEVDDTVIVLNGIVARSSGGKKSARRGMGIQFTDVSPEAADTLARLLGPQGG